ncbi:hypothetical protein R1flu_008814 [Riccia fluitans]|uniref:Uncharacterized protein n=1 Tax=Riccia fluitans TaxID=41844 RepID=A0ABD1Z3C2_9MARC
MVRFIFAPIPESDKRFARQYRYEPPPEFPLTSHCSGIVHHLSGAEGARFPEGGTRFHQKKVLVGLRWHRPATKADFYPVGEAHGRPSAPRRAADQAYAAVPHPTGAHRGLHLLPSQQFQALFNSLFKVAFHLSLAVLVAIGLPPSLAFGRNYLPLRAAFAKQPDSSIAPRGAAGSGPAGLAFSDASRGLRPGPLQRTLLQTTTRAAECSETGSTPTKIPVAFSPGAAFRRNGACFLSSLSPKPDLHLQRMPSSMRDRAATIAFKPTATARRTHDPGRSGCPRSPPVKEGRPSASGEPAESARAEEEYSPCCGHFGSGASSINESIPCPPRGPGRRIFRSEGYARCRPDPSSQRPYVSEVIAAMKAPITGGWVPYLLSRGGARITRETVLSPAVSVEKKQGAKKPTGACNSNEKQESRLPLTFELHNSEEI